MSSQRSDRRIATMRAKYGDACFGDWAKRNAAALADPGYYAKLGEKGGLIGGNTTFERHGHEHYVGLGKKSAQKRREARP